MSWLLALLDRLVPLVGATARLVKAAKESGPPPPVPLEQGATTYLQGRNDERFIQDMRRRGLREISQLGQEAEKPEVPVDESGRKDS